MWEGTFTALVTPFRGGAVDEEALRGLVEAQIQKGIEGLVPCGTTGESATLDPEEQVRVIRATARQAAGRVQVIAGVGSNATRRSIELAHAARDAGADGLLVVCPYYNRPTQDGLEAHFRAIAAAVSLPVMLYNVPGRTGSDLEVETLERLADVPTLVAIKEATGNVVRAQRILGRLGERFRVFSGDDILTVAMIAAGASGAVSVTSNVFPATMRRLVRCALDGDFTKAREQHAMLAPVFDALFVESNPGPVKFALAHLGKISAEIRLPLVWPRPESQARVLSALEDVVTER